MHGGGCGGLYGSGGGGVGGIGQHLESGDPIDDKPSTMASNSNGKNIRGQFIDSLGGSTITGGGSRVNSFGMQRRIKITTKNSRTLDKPSFTGVGLQQLL